MALGLLQAMTRTAMGSVARGGARGRGPPFASATSRASSRFARICSPIEDSTARSLGNKRGDHCWR